MKITTETEYAAAQQRLAELAGCLEDTQEERLLIVIQLSMEIWESKTRTG